MRTKEAVVIEVINELTIYEIDGKAVAIRDTPTLTVKSHWNDPEWIILCTPDGRRFTLNAKDMRAAIENAANTRRF
jgi:hypothetical protein